MANFDHQGREVASSKIWRVLNSSICFVIIFLTFTYSFYLVTALAGKVFGFDSTLGYNEVKFNIHQVFWTKKTVTLICGMGPAFVLLLGLFCAYIFSETKRYSYIANVILMWGFVVGVSVFISHFFAGMFGNGDINSPYYQNMAAIYAFFSVPPAVSYFFSLGAFLALIFFSVNFAKPFMSFAFSYRKVNKLNRKFRYFLEIAILPFIIGSMVVTFITFPTAIYLNTLVLLTIAVSLGITLYSLNYISVTLDDVNRYKFLQQPSGLAIFLFFAVIVAIYILKKGINI
jgi:hypothetical protein